MKEMFRRDFVTAALASLFAIFGGLFSRVSSAATKDKHDNGGVVGRWLPYRGKGKTEGDAHVYYDKVLRVMVLGLNRSHDKLHDYTDPCLILSEDGTAVLQRKGRDGRVEHVAMDQRYVAFQMAVMLACLELRADEDKPIVAGGFVPQAAIPTMDTEGRRSVVLGNCQLLPFATLPINVKA